MAGLHGARAPIGQVAELKGHHKVLDARVVASVSLAAAHEDRVRRGGDGEPRHGAGIGVAVLVLDIEDGVHRTLGGGAHKE